MRQEAEIRLWKAVEKMAIGPPESAAPSVTKVVRFIETTLMGRVERLLRSVEVVSPLRDMDKWIRRKLRCYIWKQWNRSGYRNLRKRGVSVREAWNMAKSAHGP